MKSNEFFNVWKEVFSKKKCLIIALAIILIFYSLNVVIASYDSLISIYKQLGFLEGTKLFFDFFIGLKEIMKPSSFVSLILIAILLGILFSLITYKTIMLKSISKKTGALTTTGIFLGILAPGCAACGIGLLSIFGLSAATITFLPFEGLELSLLAIFILGFSIFKITKSIHEGIICKIK